MYCSGMTNEQIRALKNYPFRIIESLTVGASRLRAAAEVAKAEIKQKLEVDLSEMRREYAQQVKEADNILAGVQEPYPPDPNMNAML